MIALMVLSLIIFIIGAVGLMAIIVGVGGSSDRPPPPAERPSRTVRVIRDPRFGLERHEDSEEAP